MAVLYARQVAAQQAGALLDVSLRHAFLQPVVSDGLADIDLGEHCRMRHINHPGIFWQVEFSAITKLVQSGLGRSVPPASLNPLFLNSVQEILTPVLGGANS